MGHFLCFHKKKNVIFLTRKNPNRLSLGPSWYMVVVLIIIFLYALYENTKIYTNPYHIFIACILLMQAIMRLIIIAISDPGYIIEEDNEDIESEIVCTRCNMHIPPETEHCQDCDLCVHRRDHHCFWIGKCVGAKNLVHFSNFCLSVVLYFCYVIVTRIPFIFNLIESAYK